MLHIKYLWTSLSSETHTKGAWFNDVKWSILVQLSYHKCYKTIFIVFPFEQLLRVPHPQLIPISMQLPQYIGGRSCLDSQPITLNMELDWNTKDHESEAWIHFHRHRPTVLFLIYNFQLSLLLMKVMHNCCHKWNNAEIYKQKLIITSQRTPSSPS